MLVTDSAVLLPILCHQYDCNPFEFRATCSYYRAYIVLKYHDDHHSRRSLFLILSFWWSKMAIYQPKLGCKYWQVSTTGIKYLSVFGCSWYRCSTCVVPYDPTVSHLISGLIFWSTTILEENIFHARKINFWSIYNFREQFLIHLQAIFLTQLYNII